jgi:hypothetical protein
MDGAVNPSQKGDNMHERTNNQHRLWFISLFLILAFRFAEGQVWQPAPRTTWEWQITGNVKTSYNVKMYDVDLQDAVPSPRTYSIPGFGSVTWPKGQNAGIVDQLHSQGRIAICYMDSGAYETYRPDAPLFPKSVIGNNTGWNGEYWLDIRPQSWSKFEPIILARLDLAHDIGCDGVEPDQNNPYGNNPGFPVTLGDEKAWYLEVAAQAHNRNLSAGMKNGVEVVDADTVRAFDWSLNEECYKYQECSTEDPFISAGKAVFHTEYMQTFNQPKFNKICANSTKHQFSTIVKHLSLDSWAKFCP